MTNEFSLTGREWEVLSVAALELGDAATGKQLFMAAASVEGHLANIMNKTGILDRGELLLQFRSGKLRRND